LAAHLFSQAGARNFLIVSIPPLHRSPIIKSLGSKSVERFKVEASSYNARLVEIAHALGNSDGASVFYYDTTDLFQRVGFFAFSRAITPIETFFDIFTDI
jgi:phospholipase/lecithinase/hemolysin